MKPNIVGVEWRSGSGSVCAVAVDYGRYWQAYIGPARAIHTPFGDIEASPSTTEKHVAENGAKLSWQEAAGFFPYLDIRKYKTYTSK